MAAPSTGVCEPWITDEDVRECCDGLTEDFDLTRPIIFSNNILFRLSGRKYPGICERTVRPCFGDGSGCSTQIFTRYWSGWNFDGVSPWSFPTWPVLIDGDWFNVGVCGGVCDLPVVPLPSPVDTPISVVIDGVELDPSAYDVQEFRYLRRLDGGTWPCSNDMTKDSSVASLDPVGTWEITYPFGQIPGEDGLYAAAIFACQLAKAQCGSDDCVLPQRLKRVYRDNVSMEFAFDSFEFLDAKVPRVGIYEVDLWLRSENPGGHIRKSYVRRLDRPGRWRGRTG